ncbi:MAG TPA: ABC transporter permease [Leptospiraceae bacterium]|nr:ABC transporter permease [Spirochaetaceae bacterium]HBS03346.1 ABC transporter permease [Leptospiraceae bacterium]
MVLAVITGLVLGALVASPALQRYSRTVLSISAATQAIPPVAVIALAFLFAGIGALPVILALYLYSIVPVLFNSVSGLTSVPEAVIRAGQGMGFTESQVLFRIRFPLAGSIIMAGIRSAATINIGAATIASIIGGGGLGDLIFMGLKLYRIDMIFVGAILCAVLALAVDLVLALFQRSLHRWEEAGA